MSKGKMCTHFVSIDTWLTMEHELRRFFLLIFDLINSEYKRIPGEGKSGGKIMIVCVIYNDNNNNEDNSKLIRNIHVNIKVAMVVKGQWFLFFKNKYIIIIITGCIL